MVNIDTVYQKVLAIANKEQRGYITPQEFNLFADNAQKEIFEQYFYDLNQFKRVPGNNTGYADMVANLEEKISLFERYDKWVNVTNDWGDMNLSQQLPRFYRMIMVRVSWKRPEGKFDKNPSKFVQAEHVSLKELTSLSGGSMLTKPTRTFPIYTKYANHLSETNLKIYPRPQKNIDGVGNYPGDTTLDRVLISYIQTPKKPNWNYQVVNKKPFFLNDSNSRHFDLHESEESELVYRILALAGITLQKPELTQSAITLETQKVQQEKQ